MNTGYLFRRLVLPLMLGSATCVLISIKSGEPFRGLLVNMAAACLGSIITVFYVDVVLKRHQAALWGEVRSKVLLRLERLGFQTVSSVRLAFGISVPDALRNRNTPDFDLVRTELLRLAELVFVPTLPHVEQMDQSLWLAFASNLQGLVHEIDRLITLFSRNLDVKYMELLMRLQEDVLSVLANYSIWPDLLGVPYGQAPPKRDGSPSTPIQRAANTVSAEGIEKLLVTVGALLRQLPSHSSLDTTQ